MQTLGPVLWSQLEPEQRARVIAILVEMLLRYLEQQKKEARNESR